MQSIQLFVGLGNPGPQYQFTRHNAGVWFIDNLANTFNVDMRPEPKLKGSIGTFLCENVQCRLFIPNTFMNHSGQALGAVSHFYKLNPESILVAHDDLDLPVGTVRLKQSGGHGGHNGLRDIITHLNSSDFFRLRIGIGHPGNSKDVVNFVLNKPGKEEEVLIRESLSIASDILPLLINGQSQKAMQLLHTN